MAESSPSSTLASVRWQAWLVSVVVLGTVLLQELDGADAAEVVRRVAHPGGSSEAGVTHLRATLPSLYEQMLQKMHKW